MPQLITAISEAQKLCRQLFDQAVRAVFLGGAGVSVASGIPDFRGNNHITAQEWGFPVETILSRSFFKRYPEIFYEFYKQKMLHLDVLPNQAHIKLAELEAQGKLAGVVTQNIDCLHQKAGSKTVFELHGNVEDNYCPQCHKHVSAKWLFDQSGVPTCPDCGCIIETGIVLYEDPLNMEVFSQALHSIEAADLVVVGGTSLQVYPAASLVQYLRPDAVLVLINMGQSPADNLADYVIHAPIEQVFSF